MFFHYTVRTVRFSLSRSDTRVNERGRAASADDVAKRNRTGDRRNRTTFTDAFVLSVASVSRDNNNNNTRSRTRKRNPRRGWQRNNAQRGFRGNVDFANRSTDDGYAGAYDK